MNELQAQLDALEAKKNELFEEGTVDQVQISRLNEQIKAVQAQIAQQTAQIAVIEEKVNSEDVPFAVAGVDFTKVPAGLVEVIELVVKADRRRTYTAQAELDAKKEADFAAYKAQAEQRIAELQKEYKDLEQECVDMRNEVNAETAAKLQAISERDEARANRDNAAAQLDEANKEIARLNSQVADYQKAKVFGEVAAQQIIETSESEASAINTALQKFYTSFENYGSINKVTKPDGSTELVKSDALMNEWTKAPAGGSETSQGTFPEDTAPVVEGSGVPDSSTITPPPFGEVPFQTEVQDAQPTVEGQSPDGEVAPETPVSRSEFEALKRDVEALKQAQVGAAA